MTKASLPPFFNPKCLEFALFYGSQLGFFRLRPLGKSCEALGHLAFNIDCLGVKKEEKFAGCELRRGVVLAISWYWVWIVPISC